ncbi:dual specificity phosphatase 28 isoform X2 [Rhincodon typus]|uniref:dual specificity phosphatase 28 isoform X2 n=1 Tax=Rhincodon typus TaxID=259920 RepID=UPI00202F120A|nr:dual specificity phosphatase 28 isoform X2 [Rhincodon typus]
MLHLCPLSESLLISNSRSACDTDLLCRERVTFCINVSKQQPFPALKISGMRVPVFDEPAENLYKYFDRCADAIEDAGKQGGRTLVYCKNGRSRSAAICTAYFMKHRSLSLQEAFGDVVQWMLTDVQVSTHRLLKHAPEISQASGRTQ